MNKHLSEDIKAWKRLTQLMPDWLPTLEGLQKFDQEPPEVTWALWSISRGWDRDDARWDVLQGLVEYYKRQALKDRAGEEQADG